jgi:hypothetical protein
MTVQAHIPVEGITLVEIGEGVCLIPLCVDRAMGDSARTREAIRTVVESRMEPACQGERRERSGDKGGESVHNHDARFLTK